eukprot:m.273935 g.273935  ORF g.273935 m.273935 type:complete len:111 (-) comp54823_c0_seq14:65-397(-)
MTRTPQHPPLRPAPRPIRSLLIRISAMPPSVMIKLRGTSQHCTNPQQLSKGVFAGSVPSERAQDAGSLKRAESAMRTGRSIPKSASLTVRLEPDAKTAQLEEYLDRELVD